MCNVATQELSGESTPPTETSTLVTTVTVVPMTITTGDPPTENSPRIPSSTMNPGMISGPQPLSSSTPDTNGESNTESFTHSPPMPTVAPTTAPSTTIAPTTSPSTHNVHPNSHHDHAAIAAGVIVPVAVILIALTVCLLRRHKRRTAPSDWFTVTGILPKPGLVPIQSRFVCRTREPEEAPPAYERAPEPHDVGAHETQ
ncbi:hypothetical protein C8Q72DRAFT_33799 [Fomitopsis betulina]|nr:hypothetical protein C8Q72DRAFT_33799 [Fomitopsis betulina]